MTQISLFSAAAAAQFKMNGQYRRRLLGEHHLAIGFSAALGAALGFSLILGLYPAVAATGAAADSLQMTDSQPGNYLAALIASADRDTASAEGFYRQALSVDPRNADLIERAFAAALANGDEQSASSLAERLLQRDPDNSLARLSVAVRALERGQYPTARAQLSSVDAHVRDVTATFLTAWTYAAQMDLRRAIETLDHIKEPALAAFRDYHAGLIADQLGDPIVARKRLGSAYETDKTTLRFVDAYASFLADHGEAEGAKAIYRAFALSAPHHPLIEKGLSVLASGQPLEKPVHSAKDGAAEVLYGLGSAGVRQGDQLSALIYLRLALYLRPTHDLAAIALANLLEQMKQSDAAIAAFDLVLRTSPFRPDADIQTALDLDASEKSEQAMQRLTEIVNERPHDSEALSALAGLQRSKQKYRDAAAIYDRAIAAVGIPQRDDWTLFYFRGICYERDKQWPKAEADFRKALELYPDQPLVLNYLGYSWIDQGINLEEAFKMLRRAVEMRPNDGYIVDSLGWAHFKLGQYIEATQTLERAISLKPSDPVLNDHLGDAYWRVDRKIEARFQWNHARDFGPEPSDLPSILRKIQFGLPDAASSPVAPAQQNGG